MLSELKRSHIVYHAVASENINTSIENAKKLAARESFRQNKHIKCIFVFNDVIMEVSQYSDLQERASFFTAELDRHSKEYHQSDEYKRYEEEHG